MRLIAAFSFVGVLGLFLPLLSYGQDLELCGDNATLKTDCDEKGRYCIVNTTSADEFCGACVNGTIEDFTAPSGEEIASCISIENITWDNFTAAFGDAIGVGDNNTDISARLLLLLAVAKYVSEFNSGWPPPAFSLRLNKYSALNQEEIIKRNGFIGNTSAEDLIPFLNADNNTGRNLQEDLPLRVDWVEMNAVTSVKDQGLCGCCWSVAVVGVLEGSAAITSNFTYLEDLSWQQLISCDDDQSGCDGGNVITALQYTEQNEFGGVATNDEVPFTDKKGTTTEQCPLSEDDSLAVQVPNLALAVSSTWPTDVSERILQMKMALVQQPLAVVMNSDCTLFNNYGGGIMTDDQDCACNDVDCIDHAVLMVGYDDTTDPVSFKFKNSWGTGWGEDGYFRVAQSVDQDTMQYGLFGLLYEGSAAVDVTNQTAATGSAAPSNMQAGSAVTWIVAVVGSVIALSAF